MKSIVDYILMISSAVFISISSLVFNSKPAIATVVSFGILIQVFRESLRNKRRR